MQLLRFRSLLLIALASGCGGGFKLVRFTTSESLFVAARGQFQKKKWDNAVAAFEKLTLDLPARDTLLPVAHYYLAKAHSGRGEHLLGAQEFNRLSESFATDTLADDALFLAGKEYQLLWRKPVLDSQYGSEALATFESLIALYPDSDLREKAMKEIEALQEQFASKDYANAMYYFRRKAYDPALIYFRDVVKLYPRTARSRDAMLRMAEAYEAIRWKEDKADVCKVLREQYPTDREVPTICGPAAASTAKRDSA